MSSLIITILLTSLFFVIFKIYKIFHIDTLQAIVVNYITCVFVGILFLGVPAWELLQPGETWIYFAFLIGLLFVTTFNLMAVTVSKVSMSVAGVANKISLIIPVTYSIIFIDTQAKEYTFVNYAGIAIGLIAIIFTSIRNEKNALGTDKGLLQILLPLSVFFMGGIIDLLLNIVNYHFLSTETQKLFPITTFFAAALVGTIYIAFKVAMGREKIKLKNIIGGVSLGIPNFFSIYYLLRALSDFGHDGSFVFPVLNISVIVLTAFIGTVFFKEKLLKINFLGIILALIAIWFIFL